MANVNTTCLVTGDIETPGTLSAAGGIVEFTLNRVDTSTGQVLVPIRQSVTVGSDGTISIPLWRNALGDGDSFYSVVFSPAGSRQAFVLGEIVVPDAPTADLNALLATFVQNADLDAALVAQAQAAAQEAAAYADLAQANANDSKVYASTVDLPAVTTADNGTWARVLVSGGVQAWLVVAGAWEFQSWLSGPEFNTLDSMIADSAAYTPGSVIKTVDTGFYYTALAAGAVDYDIVNAGGSLFMVNQNSDESFSVSAWGAGADVASVIAKIQARLPSGRGATITLPMGDSNSSSTIIINRPIRLVGAASAIAEFPTYVYGGSRIFFPAGVGGVAIEAGGNNAICENFCVIASGKSGFAHGFDLKRRAQLRFCVATDFSGNGFNITGTSPQNVNLWRMEYCKATGNSGDGLYIDGADANAGTNIGFDATGNYGWAIRDSSFLGCHHYGCHSANNVGSYRGDSENAAGSFINCYSENKQLDILPNYIVSGGSGSHHALSGASGAGSALYVFENTTGVHRVSMTNAGSGYTSVPVVTFDPPSGFATATATAIVENGVIVRIALQSQGAGYYSAPSVTITDPTGSGASAEATITKPLYGSLWGIVWNISVTQGGSGYTAPVITISDPVTQTATGVAVLSASGSVSHVIVTDAGYGYTVEPAVSFSGGGGTGAAATTVLARGRTHRVGTATATDEIITWRNSAVGTGSSGELTRLKYVDGNSGDIVLEHRSIAARQWLYLTGEMTRTTFGSLIPKAWITSFKNGIGLGANPRIVTTASTIPPTAGHFARGDIVFDINPIAGGSPGVVCTTGGLAGSTAVFKAMPNLAA